MTRKQLYQKHSWCLKANDDIRKGAPFYPIAFGFEFGTGWDNLVDKALSEIKNHFDNKQYKLDPDKRTYPQLVQAKEKFGELRLYFGSQDDYMSGVIDLAETLSHYICEQCGATPAIRNTNGWIYTRCEKCWGDAWDEVKLEREEWDKMMLEKWNIKEEEDEEVSGDSVKAESSEEAV